MRKIEITPELVAKVDLFFDKIFDDREFTHPLVALENLKKIRGFSSIKKKEYIETLRINYYKILKLKPSEFQKWKNKFDKIIHHSKISTKFYKRIVKELRYQELRDKEYLSFAKEFNLKSCIYCNAQLTTIANVEFFKNKPRKGEIKRQFATFELDHSEPKSKFPFLATSFFNLLPCCANCNKSKSDNPIDFNLYAENQNLDFFYFKLDRNSEQKYWLTKDSEDLVISFETDKYGNESLTEIMDKTFHIKGIYDTQKDIVAELLNIRDAYRNAYKRGLVQQFDKKIFADEAMIDRLLIGNYSKKHEIHSRPLAKFTQDIAKQLKLIPDK
jgi:hypothetical protein